MIVDYDVGDFEYLRLTISSIESDPAKLKSEERKARFPFFDVLGVLGGWVPSRILLNIGLIVCLIVFRPYLVLWESALFISFFALYMTESGRRASFMARDVERYFRAEQEERPTILAGIILSHQQYFTNAVVSPTSVSRHFKHVRFMNAVGRVTANLPIVLYGSGLGFLVIFIFTKTVDSALLGIFLVIGALLSLPISVVAAMSVDRARRSIPPVLRQEDVEVAISEQEAAVSRTESERKNRESDSPD
jgi:hypothetical protein